MAKSSKGKADGIGFRLLAYGAMFLCFGSAFWYWGLGLGSAGSLSESHKRLQQLSREHPEAEVFEVPSNQR